jgi:ribosomal protein S18 acetylase RimI-like enzyme
MNEAPDLARETLVTGVPVWIRPCRAEDLPGLEWGGVYREQRELAEQTLAAMERGEQLMWVADVGGFPVGQIWLDLAHDRLWAARVFPALRGRGIGSRLARAAERELTARGRFTAWVAVEEENTAALGFWMSEGYRPVAVQSRVQLLEKDLTGSLKRAAISPGSAPLEPAGPQSASPAGRRGARVGARTWLWDSWPRRDRPRRSRTEAAGRRRCR